MIARSLTRTLGVLSVAALAFAAAPSPASAKDNMEALIVSYGFQYAPLLVAKELGYFDEENIELSVTRVAGGARAMAAVAGGSAQVALSTPPAVFRARAQGVDMTIFGANFIQLGSNIVITSEWAKKHNLTADSPYEDKLKALRGITLGVNSYGSGGDQIVRYLAEEAGLNSQQDMTITALGTSEAMLAGLVQGRIDGFVQSSPAGENAIQNHGAVMFMNVSAGEIKSLDGFVYIVHIAREGWLKENEDLAVRYMRAIQKAMAAIHDPERGDKARDAVYNAYHSSLDKTVFDTTWESHMAAFPKDATLTAERIDQVVDFMNKFEDPVQQEAVDAGWTNAIVEKSSN